MYARRHRREASRCAQSGRGTQGVQHKGDRRWAVIEFDGQTCVHAYPCSLAAIVAALVQTVN